MADETVISLLQDIKSGVGGTNTRLTTTNSELSAVNAKLNTIISLLTELRGAVVDVRNQVSDVKVVRIYIGTNPVLTSMDVHTENAEKEFTELYNSGYRILATLGSDRDWATVIMGKYPAPNTAK